jgi:hypothetical protein
MEKIYITNHVKSEILNICGLPALRPYNLNGLTSLFNLGINNKIDCITLEGKLRLIAAQYETGRNVMPDTISTDFTVNQCVELIVSRAK